VPTPQEVSKSQGRRELPEAAVIVLGAEAHPKSVLAAEEINGRISELGGKPLRVVRQPLSRRASGRVWQLLLGTPQDNRSIYEFVKKEKLTLPDGDQGYVIRFLPDRAILAGTGPQGVLYAAATLRQLLRRQGKGRIAVETFDIRDWPDFHHRVLGKPVWAHGAHGKIRKSTGKSGGTNRATQNAVKVWLRDQTDYVDWCLRNKINYVTTRKMAKLGTHVEGYGGLERATWRRLTDYGRARGVAFEAIAYTAMGSSKGAPADWKKCVHLSPDVTFCWSREVALRKKAQSLARFANDVGLSLYYLHSPDAGVSGTWESRCPRCKAKWKDEQRADADAWVLRIFYDEIRRLNPELKIAYVVVPYSLRRKFDRIRGTERRALTETIAYWRRVHQGLPKDVAVVFRETTRECVDLFRNCFRGRDCYFYNNMVAVFGNGWIPLFSTTVRYAKTYFSGQPGDVYFTDTDGAAHEIYRAACNEFAWNTEAPGAALQSNFNAFDPFKSPHEPAIVAKDLLDRICKMQYGPSIGPIVARAIQSDFSWTVTRDPLGVLTHEKKLARRNAESKGWDKSILVQLSDTAGILSRQRRNSSAAVSTLEEAVQSLQKNPQQLDGFMRRRFDDLLTLASATKLLSGVQCAYHVAVAAIQRGEPKDATRLAAQGLADLDKDLGEYADKKQWLAGKNQGNYPSRRVEKFARALRPELVRLERLGKGTVLELADSPGALAKAKFLLHGSRATATSSRHAKAEISKTHSRIPGRPSLRISPTTRPWTGAGVLFDPVDVRPFLKSGGFLRFYINSGGPVGGQQGTLKAKFAAKADGTGAAAGKYVFIHKPSRKQRATRKRPGYVTIDALEETWQLVSIPLHELAGENLNFLVGFDIRFANVTEYGLTLSDPYLIGAVEPTLVERHLKRKR